MPRSQSSFHGHRARVRDGAAARVRVWGETDVQPRRVGAVRMRSLTVACNALA